MNEREQREVEVALDKLRPPGRALMAAGWRVELIVFAPTEIERLGDGYKVALVLPLDAIPKQGQ